MYYGMFEHLEKVLSDLTYRKVESLHNFSLETVYYELLKSSTFVMEGKQELDQLLQQYATNKELCFNLEELLDSNLIIVELDEWHIVTDYLHCEHIPAEADIKTRTILEFLIFLQEKKYENKYLKVNTFDEILEQLSTVLSEIPNRDWFVEKNLVFLLGDSVFLDNGFYQSSDGVISKSIAKIWMYCVDKENEQEKLEWLKKAICVNASPLLFRYLDSDNKKSLLNYLLAYSAEDVLLGSLERETHLVHIARQSRYSRHKNILELTVSPRVELDRVKNLIVWDRANKFDPLRDKRSLPYFVSQILLDGLDLRTELVADYDYVAILERFFRAGYFLDLHTITTANIVTLARYPQLKFMAVYLFLQQVESSYRGRENLSDNKISLGFSELLSVIIQYGSDEVTAKELSDIAYYLLSYCSFFAESDVTALVQELSNNRRSDLYKTLLHHLLRELESVYLSPIDKIITDTKHRLEIYDDRETAQNIALLIMIRHNYKFLNRFNLETIYSGLNDFVQRLFVEDRKYSNVFLSSEFWCNKIWLEVYCHVSDEDKETYRTPITLKKINEVTSGDNLGHTLAEKKKAVIQLGILSSIGLAIKSDVFDSYSSLGETIEQSLISCMVQYRQNSRFDIFHFNWIENLKSTRVLKQVLQLIDVNDSKYEKIKEQLASLPWIHLVSCYGFSENEELNKYLYELLSLPDLYIGEEHLEDVDQIFRIPDTIDLVRTVAIEKLTMCYEWAEKALNAVITEIESRNRSSLEEYLYYARYLLNNIYFEQKRWTTILESDDDFAKGVVYFEQDDFYSAFQMFKSEIAVRPNNDTAYANAIANCARIIEISITDRDRDTFNHYVTEAEAIIEAADTLLANWETASIQKFAQNVGYFNYVRLQDETQFEYAQIRYGVIFENISKETIEMSVKAEELPSKSDLEPEQLGFSNEQLYSAIQEYKGRLLPFKSKLYLQGLNGVSRNEVDAWEQFLTMAVYQSFLTLDGYITQLKVKNLPSLSNKEDRYTELFRQIFNHKYQKDRLWGVTVTDQRKDGPAGKELAEVDLTFSWDFFDAGSYGEAVIVSGISRKKLSDHLNKLIATSNQTKLSFFIVYYDGKNFGNFVKNYEKYLTDTFGIEKSGLVKNNQMTTTLFDENVSLYDTALFGSGGKILPIFCSSYEYDSGTHSRMYHILLDVADSKRVMHAKLARS